MSGKRCIHCGKEFVGRSDKIYCSDGCRTASNNEKYAQRWREVRKIDRILKRNYGIVSTLAGEGIEEIPFVRMAQMGFHFGYITSVNKGTDPLSDGPLLGCYNYTLRIDGSGMVHIGKEKYLP